MKINLGAGQKHLPGYISIDLYSKSSINHLKAQNVNYVDADALQYVESLPDSSVESVYSRHFLEHLDRDKIIKLLSEIERILMIRGTAQLIVPHWSNPYYYSDPTHIQHFGLYTFDYLLTQPYFRRGVPSYARICDLSVFKVSYRFISLKCLRPFTHLLSLIISSNRMFLEFYEANLANILPPYEIEFLLIKN